LVNQGEKIDLPMDSILTDARISRDDLGIKDRVAQEKTYRLWEIMAKHSELPSLGLKLAEDLPRGSFELLEYVIRNMPSLDCACKHFARYAKLIHNGAAVGYTFESGASSAALSYSLDPGIPFLPPDAAEFVIGAWYTVGKQITGVAFKPVAVRFQHHVPANNIGKEAMADYYQTYFGCPVHFGNEHNSIEFDANTLGLPIVNADPGLKAVLDRFVDDRLAKLPQTKSLQDRISSAIHEGYRSGEVNLEYVADKLRVSPRTLQRRLKEADTTYQEVVDEMRRGLAKSYLCTSTMSIGEISFLLGFSEPSAFHRAFKRWSGTTPGEFRR